MWELTENIDNSYFNALNFESVGAPNWAADYTEEEAVPAHGLYSPHSFNLGHLAWAEDNLKIAG